MLCLLLLVIHQIKVSINGDFVHGRVSEQRKYSIHLDDTGGAGKSRSRNDRKRWL